MAAIVFLTGASGVGKTSIVDNIAVNYKQFTCLHFDSIEVPGVDVMDAEFNGPANWQKIMTEE